MRIHQIFLSASLILSILFIGYCVTSNPNSTILHSLSSGDYKYRLKVAASIIPIWLIGSWPWLLSIFHSSKAGREGQAVVLSILSLAPAAYTYSGFAQLPSEGIGIGVIIYYVLIWILYPVSFLGRSKN